MSGYVRKQIRIEGRQWARLEAMVEEMGGTVTPDYFINAALETMFEDGSAPVDNGVRPTVQA